MHSRRYSTPSQFAVGVGRVKLTVNIVGEIDRSIDLSHINMESKRGFESYVVVHNIAKRHNVGTLARSATAFGVSELILVGRRDFNSFGSHGSTSHVLFRHFHSLSDARLFLKVILSLSLSRSLILFYFVQFRVLGPISIFSP